MSDDFAAIMTGESTKAPKKTAAAPAKTYEPLDAAIRTVYAENPKASDEEVRALASAIANRAKRSGKTVGEVVQEDGQFEPWSDAKGRARIDSLKADSPEYARLAGLAGDILGGKAAPTTTATHFYAPEAQAELAKTDGRPVKPEWDNGSGTRIGAHLFIDPDAAPKDDFAAAVGSGEDHAAQAAFAAKFGDPAKFADGAAYTGEGLVPFTSGQGSLNKAQTKAHGVFVKGGGYDPEAPPYSAKNPSYMVPGSAATEKDVPPGGYFFDLTGKLKRAPGGADDKPGGFGEGFSRGIGDVMLSAAQMAPGTDDSVLRNRFQSDQQVYNADHGGEPLAGAGRFTGQIAATIPALAGGEAMVAPALARMGGTGAFLAGRAGMAAAPEGAGLTARLLGLGVRGSSLAASGAAEGAAAAALTSSASDAPLSEQMATGAVLGGLLKPVATGVMSGVRRFFGPSTAGAAPVAEQAAIADKAAGLPVKVPLDAGQMSGAPARQGAVDAIMRGAEGDPAASVVQGFRAVQQGALRENVNAISTFMGGGTSDVDAGAAVSGRLNEMRQAMAKEIDAAYDAARARGQDAMLASAKEVRDQMLEGLRANFELDAIKGVTNVVESLGEKGAPTVRELFEARTKLGNFIADGGQTAKAAKNATRVMDAYMDSALKHDLFLGDPAAVKAWKEAVSKRAASGKLFEGDDLIEGLTTRGRHGEGVDLKVAPEEAANYILNRSALGFIGKKDLNRDLVRLRGVLGKDSEEWNGLRAEVFKRIARAGEGSPEGGVPQFSGQNFQKAWEKSWRENPQVMQTMFSPYERKIIDDFAEVAQVATTPVKGAANTSNSAIVAKRMGDKMMEFMATVGGTGGGAAVGGVPGAIGGAALGGFLKSVRELLAVSKARKLTFDAKPGGGNEPGLQNKILGPAAPAAAAITGNRILSPQPVAPAK